MTVTSRHVVAGLITVSALLLGGWGSVGHRIINGGATIHLPAEMGAFLARRTWLEDSASVADWRKSGSNGYAVDDSEGPKHYLDVDDYPEYLSRSVPTDLSTLLAQYGSYRVTNNGFLPWTIGATTDSLTAQMSRGAWSRVWSTAADLGHYVADAHNPLHCTVDYNGRAALAGSSGIHSRYESSMISRFSSLLTFQADTVEYVAEPVLFAFAFIYDSQALVDSVYAADLGARTATGWSGSGSVPTAYLDGLWARSGAMTRAQFQRATKALASLFYTAWVDAGKPALPQITHAAFEDHVPAEFSLFPPYPNPFNPTTAVEFELAHAMSIRLEVVAIDGRVVGTLADGMFGSGRHRLQLNATNIGLSSGVYLLRLTGEDGRSNDVKKLLLLR